MATMRLVVFTALLLVLCMAGRAAEFAPSISRADLDLAHCQAFEAARLLNNAPVEALASLLGFAPVTEPPQWTTGPVSGTRRHFRIAFTHPLPIGTICTTYSGGVAPLKTALDAEGACVSYLHADAPFPGDVEQEAQWVILPKGDIKTLPPNLRTRALRFSVLLPAAPPKPIASAMGYALIFPERYYSALELGYVRTIPAVYNTPESWAEHWMKPQEVAGLVVLPQYAGVLSVEILQANTGALAEFATPEQWTKLKAPLQGEGAKAYPLPAPVGITAVRVTVTRPKASSPGFHIIRPYRE